MATYYIRKTGNNSNNGTSPSTAWATLAKALATGSTVAAGDIVYVGSGVYHEAVTVAVSGSSGSPISVIADVFGQYTGDAGPVYWSNWLGASGFNSAPVATVTACLTTNSQDDVTITGFYFVGGGCGATLGDVITATGASLRWTFNDCVFPNHKSSSNGQQIRINGDSTQNGGTMSWRFNRCIFKGGVQGFCLVNTSSATGNGNADWDYDIDFNDCYFENCGVYIEPLGGLTYKGGGINFYRCTSNHGSFIIVPGAAAGGVSNTVPCEIRNCFHFSSTGGAAMQAAAGNAIQEDYNLLFSSSPRVNVTAGANSSTTATGLYAISYGIPASTLLPGLHQQQSGEPLAWPGLFVAPDPFKIGHDVANTSNTDIFGYPRPSGTPNGNKASGAFAVANMGMVATDQFDTTPSIALTGYNFQDIYVVVPAAATTISIKARYDTTHGSTNKPQVTLMANGALGVSAQTLTMSAAVDTWETLTFSSITPTAKGMIKLRLVSRGDSAAGKAWFDTVSVT